MDSSTLSYTAARLSDPVLNFRYRYRALMAAQAIKGYFPRPSGLNILDLGAADGLAAAELDRLLPGNKIVGLEYSPELARAAKEHTDISVFQGDAMAWPKEIKNQKYDVVTALALLEHLSDTKKCLSEISANLRPGGLFIATSPSHFWDRAAGLVRLHRDETHQTKINEKTLRALAQGGGLELIEVRGFMWAPTAFLLYLRIRISPGLAMKTDALIGRLKMLNFLFVNKLYIFKQNG